MAETGTTHPEEGGLVGAGEDPQQATRQPTKEETGKQRTTVKCKKVISRKKAGKQTRTIIVSMPREEEEMVDIRMQPKKRGRPRKTPNVDPLM
jgi:ADP-ribose pyrophosphatase YjhB (NUDIX family)